MSEVKNMHDDSTNDYKIRSLHNRFGTLAKATMRFVKYFMDLGDDLETAQGKVDQLSFELFTGDSYVYGYIMGSKLCRDELFVKINASALPFMDDTAKAYLITELTPVSE